MAKAPRGAKRERGLLSKPAHQRRALRQSLDAGDFLHTRLQERRVADRARLMLAPLR